MIIDAQHHIMPFEYVEFYKKHATGPNCPIVTVDGRDSTFDFGCQVYNYQQSKLSAEASIRMMDANGIDLTLLSSQIPDATLLPGELAAEGSRIVNNAIQDTVERYPGRYKGIGFLPWNLPGYAVAEAQRIKALGFVGVMLCSHVSYGPADLPAYEPIYEELARLGLVIFLHPMIPEWGRYVSDYQMIPMMSFMFVESFCLMRLILSGIIERNPDLRIVMPHCGAMLPALSGRIQNQTVKMGRGMDNITIPPVDVLKSGQIYYDVVSADPGGMRVIAGFLGGTERLMFSTDFPWVDTPAMLEHVKEAFPEAEDRARVFSGTAIKLFGL